LRRIQWIEIHDQPWFPVLLRDVVTDALEAALHIANNYGVIVPRLRKALARARTSQIVDLCSGGGGPWPRMIRQFTEDRKDLPDNEAKADIRVCLTDKFPNLPALERAQAASPRHISFRKDPIDAMAVPAELQGFRTLFTSFPHFPADQARAILRDAAENRVGIGVFEVTHRSLKAVLIFFCLTPLGFMLLMPFVRPFRWSHLLWTYLIPIVPLVGWHDGVVSCLRTYSPQELEKLTAGLGGRNYSWEIGKEQGPRSPLPITFVIGCASPEAPRVAGNS
jgi:hypothetical protein